MKKIYVGSSKLRNHFRMVRVGFGRASEAERVKEGVMALMNGYLEKCDGKLINVKELSGCNELLVYFVTGEEEPHANWEHFLKNTLLRNYNVLPSGIEIGPRPA